MYSMARAIANSHVDVALSKGVDFDAPFGRSLCKFTYEGDDM